MAKINLAKPAKQGRFPVWIVVVAVILCLCVAAALLWQPILVALNPGLALTIGTANSVAQIMTQLRSPLTDCLFQAAGYSADGSMDISISAGSLLSKISYSLRTDSDPANRQQSSSYEITALGLTTGYSTYLDADCAAFSADLVTGGDYYGITFDTYAEDLVKAGFVSSLNPETLAKFHDYVAKLDAVYPNENARQAGLELPSIEAPDWARTLLAYITELEFESSNAQADGLSCDAITTQMDGRYAANMFLEALETVSSNVMLASSLYSDDETEDTPELQEKLEYYRDHTAGNVTLTGYLHGGALVAVDLEWVFTENNGTMSINDSEKLQLRLGEKPGEGNWTIILSQAKAGTIISDQYTLTMDAASCSYGITHLKTENGTQTETALQTRWDEASGLLTLDLTKHTGGKAYSASTSGILERTDGSVRCTVSGLHDFFQLLTLPDFLKDMNLELFSDITVAAEFTDTAQVTKPDYINLDQWELPWLLDLFL